jgi:hypothetical protein
VKNGGKNEIVMNTINEVVAADETRNDANEKKKVLCHHLAKERDGNGKLLSL